MRESVKGAYNPSKVVIFRFSVLRLFHIEIPTLRRRRRIFCSAGMLWFLSFLVTGLRGDAETRIHPDVVSPSEVSLTFDCPTDEYYQILSADLLRSGEWGITNMGLGSVSSASWTSEFVRSSLYLRVRTVPQSVPRDEDGDGLDDVFELKEANFDPLDPSDGLRDRDGDGMPDGWEIRYGLSAECPLDASDDAEADGLSNLQEFLFGTSPLSSDTDQDGLLDEEEVRAGLDPLNPPRAQRLTSVVFRYDDQDRLERVESSTFNLVMGYDAAANVVNVSGE